MANGKSRRASGLYFRDLERDLMLLTAQLETLHGTLTGITDALRLLCERIPEADEKLDRFWDRVYGEAIEGPGGGA